MLRLFNFASRVDVQSVASLPIPISPPLPVELWQLIASNLDPGSAVSFALSCHYMKWVLGERPFRELSADRVAKLEFLTSLSSLLPDHLLCAHCCTWHRRRPPRWIFWLPEPRPPVGCLSPTVNIYLAATVTLYICEAGSAVRYHKYGPRFGRPLRDIVDLRTSRSPWSFSMTSKVHDGSLLIKTTIRRDFEKDDKLVENYGSREDKTSVNTSTCVHCRIAGKDWWSCLGALLELRHDSELSAKYSSFSSVLQRCNECPSEHSMTLTRKYQGDDMWTCTISRWIDLGTCEHSDTLLWGLLATGTRLDQWLVPYDVQGRQSVCERFEGSGRELCMRRENAELTVLLTPDLKLQDF